MLPSGQEEMTYETNLKGFVGVYGVQFGSVIMVADLLLDILIFKGIQPRGRAKLLISTRRPLILQ